MRRFTIFVILLIAIFALFPLYTHFKVIAAPIPPGVYLGGLALSDLKDVAEIRTHLEGLYDQPIAIYFDETRLPLLPQDVDFQVDVEQMVQEAAQYLDGPTFVDIAMREALGFPQKRRDVPVRFTLDIDKLRAWLTSVAAAQNHPPSPLRGLPPALAWDGGAAAMPDAPTGFVGAYTEDWRWQPGRPGQTLDVEASIPPIVAALTSETKREAQLVLQEEAPAPPTLVDLQRVLNEYTADFPGFAALYIQDLSTGEEAAVDADVSFSGMSTLKIAIVTAVMEKLAHGISADDPDSEHVGQLIDYALGESNNYAANQLLTWLGDGNIGAGVRHLTDFMHSLGFVSTYMQSGYDVDVQLPQIPTPGNQRTDWNTNPDTNLQSTPAEMGRLLVAIYQCTQGQGLLIEYYGATLTPDECETILFYMSHDEFQEMLWAGLPDSHNAWIVHKHGFAYESHSDVALIWGPTGPYVVSFFVYRSGWMDWATSNSRMKGVSRAAWRFFAFRQQELNLAAPAAPLLAPPLGYAALKEYIPVASTGGK
ncbi:MAG: serine hydrolase [Caldilineaceae bacterium]